MCVRMARISPLVSLAADDLEQVVRWEAAPSTPQQVALRCRLVLAAAAGKQDLEIASIYDVNRHTAALWRQRVRAAGIGSLWEIQPGRGRKPKYDQEKRDALIAATLETKPKGMTHWSCRTLAKAQGVSHSTVNRLWQLHNLKPHLSRTFKLSRDSKFIEKLTDELGIARQLEGAAQVRLEIVQLPKPIHGAVAYSLGFRQGPAAPVRHAFGFGFQSRGNQCVSLLLIILGLASPAGLNLPERDRKRVG